MWSPGRQAREEKLSCYDATITFYSINGSGVCGFNELKMDAHTRCSHLGEEEQEDRGGVHLQVAPLVVPDNGGARLGVVFCVKGI